MSTSEDESNLIVSKFGGTSLATAESVARVCEIIKTDPSRKIVVVSAPGRRYRGDAKITDLLVSISDRFASIPGGEVVCDYVLSRGEYLMAQVLSKALGHEFVDIEKTGVIAFDNKGEFDLELSRKNFAKFRGKNIVVPGFYGVMPNGAVKTFPRGGSDITGAIMANIADATLYENWTDVDGVYNSDPDENANAKCFDSLSYDEVEILGKAGASVLHHDCIKFVRAKNIPLVVRNTFNVSARGTLIS